MDCLDNLIGIGRREGSTSESGLYLEDIGITVEDANAINDQRFVSGNALLSNVISFTQIEFENDFKTQLRDTQSQRKVFAASSVLGNGVAGYYKDNLPTLAADATKYRGITTRITQYPYISFHIGEVSLFTQATGSIDVLIYDVLENKLLDTIAVTTVAGEVSSEVVNKTYYSKKQILQIAFLYDASNAAYESDLSKTVGCRTCNKYYSDGFCQFQAVEFEQANPIIRSNIQSPTGGTAGLSVQYSLNCDIEPFICSIKNQLANAFLYKCGVNFMREWINSHRINATNKISLETLDERQQYYMGQYSDLMNNLISGIDIPNDRCFKCSPSVKLVATLP